MGGVGRGGGDLARNFIMANDGYQTNACSLRGGGEDTCGW